MFSKGTKRKFSDAGDEAADESVLGLKMTSSYTLQRQSLLDMSLIKLQLCHMLVEPNLCRSVLIANTVRQIQEEMTQDGSWHAMAEAIGVGQTPADRLEATEVLCRPPVRGQDQEAKPFSVIGYDSCHSEEVVVDETLCSTSPEAHTAYISSSLGVGPCWQGEDLTEAGEDDEDDRQEDCRPRSEGEDGGRLVEGSRATEQVFGTFEIKNPVPSPDPALEDLFSDVDASYYDLDTMLTGMQGPPKMGPYDLLESLSSHGSPSISSTASCRSDLNELDHIMEIIVGS
ncbi:cell division cycle-associated protein 4-like [Scleropages formosus]|uniref:Cell division cycle associated 4 n=1 Tax=Scleropages formosus TaxID=113540 RepID=A0A0P7WPU1_SCLFO|nr:cell division cycle-associated protein 4 [Scleropages formosus]XP_018583209.1 cell division cycle-associated protein 4 [Scleropages formosus]XP_018583210.1 cell division cycle-associated protein 4 [Scleropages formosus]XP_018583211.1 cell division cycle-associated protein 4 [Scleropages formosus]XP_018583212.1 cell division cycle-associated protein 4 [Scleropages formosus]XP_029114499.1 cell division cycle-associated protein 4 [Scleropages formosus]XP_029114500.1 cell division cycle-associ